MKNFRFLWWSDLPKQVCEASHLDHYSSLSLLCSQSSKNLYLPLVLEGPYLVKNQVQAHFLGFWPHKVHGHNHYFSPWRFISLSPWILPLFYGVSSPSIENSNFSFQLLQKWTKKDWEEQKSYPLGEDTKDFFRNHSLSNLVQIALLFIRTDKISDPFSLLSSKQTECVKVQKMANRLGLFRTRLVRLASLLLK